MDFENINLAIKVEPPMEGYENENNPLDIFSSYISGVKPEPVESVKVEPDITEQMEMVKVVENVIFDHSYCRVFGTGVDIKQERKEALLTEGFHAFEKIFDHSSGTILEDARNKSNDLFVKQSGVLVKTESSEIDIKPDIADEWKIKHEEVYIKEEDLVGNQIRSENSSVGPQAAKLNIEKGLNVNKMDECKIVPSNTKAFPKPKYCIVKCCLNTSYDSPDKMFFNAPKVSCNHRRMLWEKALQISLSGNHNKVCEDHFNLEADSSNWLWFRMMGSKLFLKRDVVPHLYLDNPPPETLKSQTQNLSSNSYMYSTRIGGLEDSLEPQKFKARKKIYTNLNKKNNILPDDVSGKSQELNTEKKKIVVNETGSKKQVRILTKRKNSATKGKTENLLRIVPKSEMVFIKEENFIEDKIGSDQGISVKSGNSKTKGEIENLSEIVSEDGKIRREVVFLKEENFIENEIITSPGLYKQQILDDHKEQDGNGNDYQEQKDDLRRLKPDEVYLFKCDKCEYQTSIKSDLKKHLLRHKEVDLLKCYQCEYQTHRKKILRKHILLHKTADEMEIFRCDKCEYRTSSKKFLKRHLLRHKNSEEVYLFRCKKCEYGTHYKKVLKRHNLFQHENPKEVDLFKCYECGYRTNHKKALRRHIRLHQPPEKIKLFRCDKCEYRTSYEGLLKKHMLIHKPPEEVDLFRCDKCKYKTRYRKVFKRHTLIHKNPKVDVFSCEKCEYKVRDKRSLQRHILRHKDRVELVKCDKCQYQTIYKRYLKQHMLRHEARTALADCSVKGQIVTSRVTQWANPEMGLVLIPMIVTPSF